MIISSKDLLKLLAVDRRVLKRNHDCGSLPDEVRSHPSLFCCAQRFSFGKASSSLRMNLTLP